jgi:UDP-glucose 4-epimerase
VKQGQDFHNKKILVTGARGFIGSNLAARLLQYSAEVHAVSRNYSGIATDPIRWWNGELADVGFVKNLLKEIKPDYIFHLSGYVTGLRDAGIVVESYHSLLTSTVNILTAVTEIECKKIILAGSLEEPEPEEVSPVPSSPYAAAKWAARGYASMFGKLYGVPVVNPRIFMVYGPGQREYRKLIPYVTISLLKNDIPKLSSGRRAIDWIYIDDVIDGLIVHAVNEEVTNSPVDIGTGQKISVKEIVEKLVAITGSTIQPVFGDLEDRPLERVTSADPDATFQKTGWKPAVSIDEGLHHTVVWYKDHLKEIDN